MATGETEFLRILKKVIKLERELRTFRTQYYTFSYDLSEKNDRLILTVYFPTRNDKNTLVYDGKDVLKLEKKLKEAENYLQEKREYVGGRTPDLN